MPGPEAKILLKEAEDRQYYDTRSILYLLALFIICEVVWIPLHIRPPCPIYNFVR